MGLISNVIATKWKSGEFGIKPNWLARNTIPRTLAGGAVAGGVGFYIYTAISDNLHNPIAGYDELIYPAIAGAAVLIAAVTTEISVMIGKAAPIGSIDEAKEPDEPETEAAPDTGAKHKEPALPSSDELVERAKKALDMLGDLEMLSKEAAALANPAKLMENAGESKPDSLATMIAKICAHNISTLDTGLDIVELFLNNREKQQWTRQYIKSLALVARAFFGEIENTSDLPNFNSFDEKEKLHRAVMVTNALVLIFSHMGYGPEKEEPLPRVIERLRQKAEAVD